jgi:hypothetical protein
MPCVSANAAAIPSAIPGDAALAAWQLSWIAIT